MAQEPVAPPPADRPPRVSVVDAAGETHAFTVANGHEDYRPATDPVTGELMVLRDTYAGRLGAPHALTGSQVVAAWPAGLWRQVCVHADPVPTVAPDDDEEDEPDDDGQADETG